MRWFRFYDEALDDPKVQKLSAKTFRYWVNLLCLANRGAPRGFLPTLDVIAFALRLDEAAVASLLDELCNATLLDFIRDKDRYTPHGWALRQRESDDSSPRVNRYRHGEEAVTVTPPEAEEIQRRNRGEEKQRPRVVFTDQKFDVDEPLWGQWSLAYPALNVPLVVRQAHAYIVANPEKKKSNWMRYLVNWLKREQDRAPARPQSVVAVPVRPAILDDPPMADEQRRANIARVAEMTQAVAAGKGMP